MNDLISRTAAINEFDGAKVDEEYCTEYDIGYNDGINFAVSRLSVLPSAQPERMRGRWIPIMHLDVLDGYRCSTCKAWSRFKYNFCRNCGADMREASND